MHPTEKIPFSYEPNKLFRDGMRAVCIGSHFRKK